MTVCVSPFTYSGTGASDGTACDRWSDRSAEAAIRPTAGETVAPGGAPQVTLLPALEDEDLAFVRACRERLGRQLRREG